MSHTSISCWQDPDETWILPYGDKKKMYGNMLVKVGGKNEPDDDTQGLPSLHLLLGFLILPEQSCRTAD